MSNHPHAQALEIACGTAGATDSTLEARALQVPQPAARFELSALLLTARPRQWVKNLLVFAAPGTAGVLTDSGVVTAAAGAFVVFCLAASGTYFVNDALGVAADRLHPTKSRRPIAAGALDVGLAKVLGSLLLLSSVALAQAVAGWRLALVVSAYAAMQPIYSAWLRNVPIADLAVVASGFVLRAVAGGVAVGVPISHWFLIVTSFGSLLLVSGKRTAEHMHLGEQRGKHRSTLGTYSLGFLHRVRSVAAAVAVAAYVLWAIEKAAAAQGAVWFPLSIVPFVLVTLRHVLLLDAGKGGCPEELLLEDRPLQVLVVMWMATVAVGIHAV
ncbi:MAG: decaprenyl-phosphate phosphoribosyltransferase [Actinomycetota bacterium]|nr:decaprenyl-phosphate phosphoribosyltransferase [Actinomycetota bacterium]